MIYIYKKAEKTSIIFNDLIKIHNERIICYRQVINDAINLDADLNQLFIKIITEGGQFKQQLINKMIDLDRNFNIVLNTPGQIYHAWQGLRVAFTGNTRNAIIDFCEYNEEVTQLAYCAALNNSPGKNNIYILIEQQQAALKSTFDSIREYHKTRLYSEPVLAYFN